MLSAPAGLIRATEVNRINTVQSPYLGSYESPTGLGRTLHALGKTHPVYWDNFFNTWVVLQRQDVLAAMHDTQTFSNSAYKFGPLLWSPVSLDGAAHAQKRRTYSHFFTPKAIAHYKDLIEPIAARVVEDIATQPSADLVEDFATRLPTEVFGALFGLPVEFVERTAPWVKAVNQWLIMPHLPEVVAAGEQACIEAGSYVRETVARQMKEPSPNLLGHIISALQTDWDATYEECEKATIILVHAGYMVLAWTLAATLAALLLHPPVLERVRNEPERVGPAVEEALRWASPFPGVFRQVTRDVQVKGVDISAGSVVFLSTAATHYDEDVYTNPEVFDLDRSPNHLAFGFGPHFCIGAPLARLEARIGLSMLIARIREMRLDPAERLEFHHNVRESALFGAETLRVLLDSPES